MRSPAFPRAVIALLSVVALLLVACGQPAASDGASLTGTLWQWTASTFSEPDADTIADPTRYTITFATDGTYSAKVDCNQSTGAFTTTAEGGISIQPGPMTLVGCPPDSQADLYLAGLLGATSYTVSASELVLTTATGTMTFSPG